MRSTGGTGTAGAATLPEVADVVIVGAGAAGGVAALRLAEAGFSVVCLEQGEWPDRASFPGTGPDSELEAGGAWSADPNVRRAPADYPVGVADSDMQVIGYNAVGGGTVLYNGVWPRLLPVDFQARSRRGVADDWPLSYEELLPFYARVDQQFGVSGLGGNPAYPEGGDPPLPPLPIGAAGMRLARAHAGLGWHWWPEANAILSRPSPGRHACAQRGTCQVGCPEGAKASTDLTHFRAAVAAGCRVVTGARVTRVCLDARDRANAVEWTDPAGRRHRQHADVVLLAANGIGTPRLLLASATTRHPGGVANSSGLVGRRLMLHPLATVTGLFDEVLGTWRGHNGSAIQSLQFYDGDGRNGFVGSAKWSLHPTGGPFRAAMTRPVWGAGHHEHVAARLGRSATWAVVCEDLPDPERRVTLSTTCRDAAGLPAPEVHYRIDDNTRRMMAWHTERMTDSLSAAGACAVEPFRALRNGHLMGTARMGENPADSVVDRWGMCHDVPNLGILDGSVFVTAGGVNPTATIAALALRAAEHLIDHRSALPRPDHAAPVGMGSLAPPRPATSEPEPGGAPGTELTAVERERLALLAEALIPPAARMPGVHAAGVASRGVDAVLARRPDLRAPLRAALAAASSGADLEGVKRSMRAEFLALTTVVAAAYYRDDGVRRALGHPTGEPVPVRVEDYPAYLGAGLLDHLVG